MHIFQNQKPSYSSGPEGLREASSIMRTSRYRI